MLKGKSAALHSLGCKVNSYETEVMEETLKNAGVKILDFSEIADIYIINTCTVTAIADKKSRQMIRRAKSLNPKAVVVACGCFVEKDTKAIEEFCDIIIGNNKKNSLLKTLEDFYKTNDKAVKKDDLFSLNTAYENMTLSDIGNKSRAFIKVQDGCNAYCSYCIIPYVRGKSRSRKLEDIVKEASLLGDKYSEIVLSGINLSDYKDNNKGLSDIVTEISKIEKVKRIRLGSLEPDVFTKNFVKALYESKKVCNHFHFSLQSACDNTLKNMRRRYSAKDVFKAAENIREYFNNPALCADVIAGFPMETKEDFELSYENIKNIGFYELHVFPYSKREGTKAAKMEGMVEKAVKNERAAKLIGLSEKSSYEFRKSLIGKEVSVLFEEEEVINGRAFWLGYSKEYVRFAMESKDIKRGDIKNVLVKDFILNEVMEVSLLF